ncbi:MAG: hypothetical protein ACR2KK_19295 [Acidimicrobiales bacterium]
MSQAQPRNRVGPIWVTRPDDLVVLTFEFENYELVPATDGATVARLSPRATADGPPRVIIGFDPQALAEQTSIETAGPPPGTGQVVARPASPSRIVVEPPGTDVEYTLEALLRLFLGAAQRTGPPTSFPVDDPAFWAMPGVTSLELPAGLVLSPEVDCRWAHADKPFRPTLPAAPPDQARATRTELWHTRLAPDTQGAKMRARAVSHTPGELPGPLSADHRRGLVMRGRGASAPLEVDRLMLSALGGWLGVRGEWEGATGDEESSVESWHHRMTMGRDQYVRLVIAGYLFPFGHRAVYVSLTQRKLQPGPDGVLGAYLRTRKFVLVRNPLMEYDHRDLPFKRVEVATLATPDLLPPEEHELVPSAGERAFWVMVGSQTGPQPFPFRLIGTDHLQRTTEFSSAVAFVDRSVSKKPDEEVAQQIRTWIFEQKFDDATLDDRRRHAMGGARLAFAPRTPAADGKGQSDPVFDTEALDISAVLRDGGTPVAPFLPVLRQARARVPALMALAGQTEPVNFRYTDAFANPGNTAAPDVFAELLNEAGAPAPLTASLAKQGSGGLVAPEMSVHALSRSFGPQGGTLEQVEAKIFDPSSFFGAADPLLLGGVHLKDILPKGEVGEGLPTTVVEESDVAVTTRFHWETTNIQGAGPFDPGNGKRLTLDVVRRAPKGGGEPMVDVTGTLHDFSLVLPSDRPLLKVKFASLLFSAPSGKKLDVSVDLGDPPVEFENELSFVRTLARIIPAGGFSDPPALSVTPEGVEVGYGLALPTVALGAFTLQNLALSAGFHLPLSSPGAATVGFHVSERHDPFIVTYSALGGGGYFGVEVDVNGIRTVELSIEFGGAVAINLGVASGAASIMAGIYFSNGGRHPAGRLRPSQRRVGGAGDHLGVGPVLPGAHLHRRGGAGQAVGHRLADGQGESRVLLQEGHLDCAAGVQQGGGPHVRRRDERGRLGDVLRGVRRLKERPCLRRRSSGRCCLGVYARPPSATRCSCRPWCRRGSAPGKRRRPFPWRPSATSPTGRGRCASGCARSPCCSTTAAPCRAGWSVGRNRSIRPGGHRCSRSTRQFPVSPSTT